jgi:hypothetical protein
MGLFTHSELVNLLQNNVVRVVFTKVDGSTRSLRGTLQPSYLPENDRSSSGSLLTEGDGSSERVSVFDLDLNEWRSFRVSSVLSASSIKPYDSSSVF